jgi:hypothetical protein
MSRINKNLIQERKNLEASLIQFATNVLETLERGLQGNIQDVQTAALLYRVGKLDRNGNFQSILNQKD